MTKVSAVRRQLIRQKPMLRPVSVRFGSSSLIAKLWLLAAHHWTKALCSGRPAMQVFGPELAACVGLVEFDVIIRNEPLLGDGRATLEPAGLVDVETHEHRVF